ncbi:MAG: alpha/beta hydrolase [Sphingobium sp.]
MSDNIDRAFVRIVDGEVHMRRLAGAKASRPLLLLHASPGSSRSLIPLMRALGQETDCPDLIAPDTPGNGDSFAPTSENPDIAWFAGALMRLLDRMGIKQADLYGAHTGARIACEAAALHPDRFANVIFDGIGDYAPDLRALLLERYAPEQTPDDYGRHLIWAFNFVRDQALHFPYFERDPAHRLMSRSVPDAAELHAATLEVLKGLTSYHKPYRAAFAYEARTRMPDIAIPALLLSATNELPTLRAATQMLCERLPDGEVVALGPTPAEKARAILSFVNRRDAPSPAPSNPRT